MNNKILFVVITVFCFVIFIPYVSFDNQTIAYYWDYASEFVLADNFFSSVNSRSAPNHLYLIAGQSGIMIEDGPTGGCLRDPITGKTILLNLPVIMDELNANNISWK